jgi:hypothetical protein
VNSALGLSLLLLGVPDAICHIQNTTDQYTRLSNSKLQTVLFLSILIHNNPTGLSMRTWLANFGDPTPNPSHRETIVKEISKHTSKKRSPVMLKI